MVEREELLSQEVRSLAEASCRRRCAIEEELGEIRRLLELLGLRNKNVPRSAPHTRQWLKIKNAGSTGKRRETPPPSPR
jgi:hypothetical protein